MTVAGGTAQRRWLRALLWLAGLLLAMFAVSCLFSTSADASDAKAPDIPDPVTHLVENVLGKAEPVTPKPKNAPSAPKPDHAGKPVAQALEPVTELVEPVVHTVEKPITLVAEPVAPILDQTKKTLSQAGKPVADLVDGTAPLLHLVEKPVANVLEPVRPLLDQVDHTVATVVRPVAGVVQTVAPVLDLVEAPLSLVTGSVSVLSGGLGKAVEPILVPLAQATESPLLPVLPNPKPPSASTSPPTAKTPACTGSAVSSPESPVEAAPVVTVARHAPATITAALPRGEAPATAVAARTRATTGPETPAAPAKESPVRQGFPPVPFTPISSPGNATAPAPHATSAAFAPEGVRLVLGYVVARQGDDVPLWRSIKPGSRPD